MKIEVERNGKILKVNAKVAEVLMRKGIVREPYLTRDMVAAPAVAERAIERVQEPISAVTPVGDLEGMSREELHALAKERGVKVHHMAGAEKVREALRAAE